MVLEITGNDYQGFVKNGTIEINQDFINSKGLVADAQILFKNIEDKNLYILFNSINSAMLKIEINTCRISAITTQNSIFSDLKLNRVEVSEYKEDKFRFNSIIHDSQLNSLWLYNCTVYNGLLIRSASKINDIYISGCVIDYSFTFLNSSSNKITLQSSKVDDIAIDRSDYPNIVGKTSVDNIYVFQTIIKNSIKVWEATFQELHFHKIKLTKRVEVSDRDNDVHISVPKELERVDSIKISESEISARLVITVDKLNSFVAYDTNFYDFRINFWAITKFQLNNCTFSGFVYWGFPNHQKEIKQADIQNSIFQSDFTLSDIWFKETFFVKGCIFQKYPSSFDNLYAEEGCKVNFEFSNLKNVVFQDADFMFFNFKNFDIANVEFKDCEWPTKKSRLFERNFVFDETIKTKEVRSLIIIKDIYSKLKTNFKNNSDYINYGKFHLSEQEIKKEITLVNKSWVEYGLLLIHKYISSYGENFKQPLFLAFVVTLSFSLLYLFTGFYDDGDLVEYDFAFDFNNFYPTMLHWLKSGIFSLKNILPFPISPNFYLHSTPSLGVTQTLELTQKILNIFLAASLTGALVKYLRK